MKKVFVLLQKSFFVENGIDYACAVDGGDITIFTNLKDAQNTMNEICEKRKSEMVNDKVFDFEVCESDYRILYTNTKRRYVLQIIEKYLH